MFCFVKQDNHLGQSINQYLCLNLTRLCLAKSKLLHYSVVRVNQKSISMLLPDNISSLFLSDLSVSLPFPLDLLADELEGGHHELPDGVHVPGGKDEVVRLVLLQHHPHALHVVLNTDIRISL